MPQRRPWLETLINRLFQSGEPEAELDRMAAKTENTEDVFGLGVSETELRDAISAMRDDLSSLSGEPARPRGWTHRSPEITHACPEGLS